MGKISAKKLLLLLVGGLAIQTTFACTAIEVQAQDGTVVAGRTMEWSYNMDWNFLFYPQNSTFQLLAPSQTSKPTTVVSKYAVLGIGTGLANNAMLDGQNSAGVSISGNFMPGFTQYATATAKTQNYLAATDFIRFVLSSYGSVAEVQKNIGKYTVFGPVIPSVPVSPVLHFMITDKTGANIVVEFINGKTVIFTKTAGVMTNAPNYDWHMTNLGNYINLSNSGTSSVTTSKLGDITAVGQGGGAIGLPGDYTPPSRFIKAAYLVHYADRASGSATAVNEVVHILNNVDIPLGAVVAVDNGVTVPDSTQWIDVKDLNNNLFHFADYAHRQDLVTINMNTLIQNGKQIILPIADLKYPNMDITSTLISN